MTALLVGGNGQVGREIALAAPRDGLAVSVTTRDTLDVTDSDAIERAFDTFQPRVVINASAYTAVDKAESEPKRAFQINRDGPFRLATACARHTVPLIHLSTDYVYDGAKRAPYVESDPVGPLGVYGASKLAGEDAIREVLPRHVILRTAWVYGVHGHNFVKTMLRLSRERETLRVVNDQIGSPTHAAELADAIVRIAKRITAGTIDDRCWGVFHCAGQGETSWCGFARAVLAHAEPDLGRNVPVEPIATDDFPTPAKRPRNSRLECGRLRELHGVTMRHWRDALALMFSDLRRTTVA